jgi:hypothetical protein
MHEILSASCLSTLPMGHGKEKLLHMSVSWQQLLTSSKVHASSLQVISLASDLRPDCGGQMRGSILAHFAWAVQQASLSTAVHCSPAQSTNVASCLSAVNAGQGKRNVLHEALRRQQFASSSGEHRSLSQVVSSASGRRR